MDEFLVDIHTLIFKKYVQNYHYENVQNIIVHDNEVIIHTKYSTSTISFYKDHIFEMQIMNKETEENEFYLHFQMKTLSHALELFNDMLAVIATLVHKPKLKILLSCTGGLTTSMFAMNLNECAKMLHINYEFDAIGYENIQRKISDYDLVLLAPQISYHLADLQSQYPTKIVLNIQPEVFAKYDCGKIIESIRETQIKYEKKKHASEIFTDLQYAKGEILTIIVIRNSSRIHIGYRLYDKKSQVVEDEEIIKNKITMNDFYDIIDIVSLRHKHIDAISISIPGIITNNKVDTMQLDGLTNGTDIKKLIEDHYHIKVLLINDVNSIALGYACSQNQYHDISVIFQPVSTSVGIGNIINGELHNGYSSLSGELQYMPLVLSEDRYVLNKSTEGTVELLTQLCLAVITTLAPEVVVICAQLLPSANIIKDELKKHIPEEYLPKITRVSYLHDYSFIGCYINAIRELYKEKS